MKIFQIQIYSLMTRQLFIKIALIALFLVSYSSHANETIYKQALDGNWNEVIRLLKLSNSPQSDLHYAPTDQPNLAELVAAQAPFEVEAAIGLLLSLDDSVPPTNGQEGNAEEGTAHFKRPRIEPTQELVPLNWERLVFTDVTIAEVLLRKLDIADILRLSSLNRTMDNALKLNVRDDGIESTQLRKRFFQLFLYIIKRDCNETYKNNENPLKKLCRLRNRLNKRPKTARAEPRLPSSGIVIKLPWIGIYPTHVQERMQRIIYCKYRSLAWQLPPEQEAVLIQKLEKELLALDLLPTLPPALPTNDDFPIRPYHSALAAPAPYHDSTPQMIDPVHGLLSDLEDELRECPMELSLDPYWGDFKNSP